MIAVTIDTETYPNCFLLVARICDTNITFVFEVSQYRNDAVEAYVFLCWLRDNRARAYGFNIVGFDGPILHMFMQMHGRTTAETIYQKAQAIIAAQDEDKWAHQVKPTDRAFEWVCLFRVNHFHNRARSTSLKALEFAMRMDNIEDLPFKVGTHLTQDQIVKLRDYCTHDVEATELFRLKCMDMIRFREELSIEYQRDMLNHDDVKIGSTIFEIALERSGVQLYDYGPAGRTPRQTQRATVALKDAILPWIKFERPELVRVHEWLLSQTITETKGVFKDVSTAIDGFELVFGLGGIHGSVDSEVHESDDECVIESRDVSSYYPNLSIGHNFYPQHLGQRFCEVYKTLYEQRKLHPKGSVKNAALKLSLNGTFGKSNDPYSPFYDPLLMLRITLNGQLLLCLLIEQLLKVPSFRLLMTNTDGIEYKVRRSHLPEINRVCEDWQKLTKLELECATYTKLFIKDCNNYIGQFTDEKIKRKGRYEYNLGWHQDASALVVPKVAEKVLLEGAPIRETVENWPDIYDFFIRVKVPRSSYLALDDKQIQNTSRYLVTKTGGTLTKWMPPLKGKTEWRRIGVESGWRVTVCNNVADARGVVPDYDWYCTEVEKLTNCLR